MSGLKRTGFKKPTLERKPTVHKPLDPKYRRAVSMAPAKLTAVVKVKTGASKTKTAEERAHMGAVAQLGCIVCWRLHGQFQPLVELHHPRRGAGMGQRASHMDVLGLCVEHHRGNTGVHGLGTKGFEKRYGFSEADLLEDVKERLDKCQK